MISSHLTKIVDELGISTALLVERGLCECEEADCLEIAEIDSDGREHLLIAPAAEAWRSLRASARADDVALFIVSAFRSVQRQAEIVRGKLNAGIPLAEVLSVCAPPGFSEHHSGRAVDVSTEGTTPLEIDFDRTSAFAWLTTHARDFGFSLSYPPGNASGYQYEPWHWCFTSKKKRP